MRTELALQKMEGWKNSGKKDFRSYRLLSESIRVGKGERDESLHRKLHALVHEVIYNSARAESFRRKGNPYYDVGIAAHSAAHDCLDLAKLLESGGETLLAAAFYLEASRRYLALGERQDYGSRETAARLITESAKERFLSEAGKPYLLSGNIINMKEACETMASVAAHLPAGERKRNSSELKAVLEKRIKYYEREGMFQDVASLQYLEKMLVF